LGLARERTVNGDYETSVGFDVEFGRVAQRAGDEALLLQSLDIARKQEARAWELRTSICLARLWHEKGSVEPARDLLSGAYNWFSEGFATADLKRAAELLRCIGQ